MMVIDTPIGPLHAVVDAQGRLAELKFSPDNRQPTPDNAIAHGVARELAEYFAGRRRDFTIELAPKGTPFQLAVWEELRRIPYGGTISYSELARRIGRPSAIRAVGAANGA